MTRIFKIGLLVALIAPAAAFAQRPSNTMETRSARLYLDRAEKSARPDEKQKLYEQALEMSLKAVRETPTNPRAWMVLGETYSRTGDAMGADSAFTKAETLFPEIVKETEPERVRAYVSTFNEGVALMSANKLAEAAPKLEAARVIYRKKPTAALNLGNLYARMNQADKSIAAYHAALEVLRGPERKNLKPDEEKQWAEWEEAASFNIAQSLAYAGKNDEAAQAYLDYLSHNPNNLTAKSNLAVVYTRAGKKAEAEKVYKDLLSQNLGDEEFFTVGVGLYKSDQLESAADAFRKAIAKNSAMRDAYYNLAQSLYSQITALEEARAKAKMAEQKSFDVKMKPLYDELIKVSERAHELDPNNRNILALLARSYRGMADVSDAAGSTTWRNKTLAVLKTHEALPVEITDVSLTNEDGSVKLSGKLVNLKATAGQPVKLTISFLGKDGAVVGTQEVSVVAPAVEDQTAFTAAFKSTTPVGGWRYVVVK
jgi:tetratricopeptide (TPR) repeat protein